MKNIYIIRHGESEGNARATENGEYIIDSSIKLTLAGIQQAKEAGKILNQYLKSRNGVFWVSPFTRTRETESNVYNMLDGKFRGYPKIEDPRLVEQDFGDFDFQFYEKWPEISPHSFFINRARYDDALGRFFARLENGENMLDVYNRISLFVETRLKSSKYKENIIVTHGNTSRALAMYLLNLPIESYYYSKVPENSSIRHIVYTKGRYIDKGYIS